MNSKFENMTVKELRNKKRSYQSVMCVYKKQGKDVSKYVELIAEINDALKALQPIKEKSETAENVEVIETVNKILDEALEQTVE